MPSYARRISVLVFALLMLLGLGTNQAWSVFAQALEKTYHFSNAQTQTVFATSTFVFCLSLILWGILHDRLGPRVMGAVSATLLAVGYVVTWRWGQQYNVLLISYGVLISLGITSGYVCPIATAMKWFPHHRGLVAGLAAAAFGLSPTVTSNFVQWLLRHGWPVLDIYGLMLCIYPPLVLLCAMNLICPPAAGPPPKVEVDYRRLLGDMRFWTLFVGMLVGSFPFLLVMGNAKPIGMFFGLSELVAVQAISVLAVSNAFGRVFWGGVLERLGARRSMFLAQLSVLSGLVLLLLAGRVGVVFFVAMAGIAFCYGSCFAIFPATVARLYGVHVLGSIYPLIMMAQGISSMSPLINGRLYDRTHSYIPGLCMALVVALVGSAACTIMARRAKNSL